MQKMYRYNPVASFILLALDTRSLRFAVDTEKTAAETESALQKILEAFCLRSDCQSAMIKPKFCPIKSSTPRKPEKVSVDRGREFTDDFFRFCQQNNVDF